MPIETICQGCARKLRVADEHAGKKARCPQCGLIYVVPGVAAAREPEVTTDGPTAPGEMSGDTWQVRTSDGRVYGPVPRKDLDEWFAEGRIPREALLLRQGDPRWRPAAEVYPQLARVHAGLSERNNPFAESSGSRGTRTSGQPFLQPHRGGLILALAILGWVICPVFAPFAWSMGSSDLQAIRSGRMDPGGASLTQAGMVMGMVQTILLIGLVALMCLGVFA